ncbi:DinB family protein [Spirosoma montaniterrae]|uniref:DinB-like domain-containing protein n=1 Tax=Spirosoma montaniterrae TaxID=1178516 RepID=A0A1P9WSG9_9BACT|nr:DinB family protein [Spirosoma montaniterrae]AQG78300.1 hypothetical protein AWR27_02455 [Spirosoma montaniterrae]
MSQLAHRVDGVLSDLDDLLQQLPAPAYAEPLSVFSGSSLGQHVRHVLEFFQCLTAGLATGEVDYDARQRDRQLEQNLDYARQTLHRLRSMLNKLDAEKPLRLRQSYGIESVLLVPTNVSRELVYNIEHAVHHMALVRIGVQLYHPAIQLPQHFGVAHSTLIHKQTA